MDAVSVVGMGKLGLCLAGVIADSGIRVIGVDKLQTTVDCVNAGRSPHFEPGLDELLQRVSGRTLLASTDIRRAVTDSDVTFILVQTPSLPNGRYSSETLASVLESLCGHIRELGKRGHAIVICSTIQPGTIRNELVPLIEHFSGRQIGHDIHVAYNPELVALGTAIRNFRNPDFVLIGADDPQVAETIANIQRTLTENDPPMHVMTIPSAEMVKVGLNAYLTLKISYANLMSQLAARVEGANIDHINSAIGADQRIGKQFFRAGPSFGGTCFPRDVEAFVGLCEDLGIPSDMGESIRGVNLRQDDLLENASLHALAAAKTKEISIIGMAFKPKTPIIVESATVKLAQRLLSAGYEVHYYDDHAMPAVSTTLKGNGRAVCSTAEAVRAAPVVVLNHATPEAISAIYAAPPTLHGVVDCWGSLDPAQLPSSVSYLRLGQHWHPREGSHEAINSVNERVLVVESS